MAIIMLIKYLLFINTIKLYLKLILEQQKYPL